MKNRIEERCRARGIRWTEPRRLIVQVLSEARDHPDAEALHRRVAERNPRVSRSTVYRTLRVLRSVGIVEEHHFRKDRGRYEPVPRRHHDHLIDVATGTVLEFRNAEIERLQKEVAEWLGYRLIGHRLELYAEPWAPNDAEAAGSAARSSCAGLGKKSTRNSPRADAKRSKPKRQRYSHLLHLKKS